MDKWLKKFPPEKIWCEECSNKANRYGNPKEAKMLLLYEWNKDFGSHINGKSNNLITWYQKLNQSERLFLINNNKLCPLLYFGVLGSNRQHIYKIWGGACSI